MRSPLDIAIAVMLARPDDRSDSMRERVERAAWDLVLNGAESHVEDAIDEGGRYSDDEWSGIWDHAMYIIRTLRYAVTREYKAG